MKKLCLLIFISACSSSAENIKKNYQILNELWVKQATQNEVIKTLGDEFKVVDSGIVYTYPNSERPKIGLFFDTSKKLVEQFVFLQEEELQEFKTSISCDWKEIEEVRDIAHYQRTIKKGSCTDLGISYETYLDLHAYEVRWKK